MSDKVENVTAINEDEIRAKIEAEIKAEYEAKLIAEIEAREKAEKDAEGKTAKAEAMIEKELARQEKTTKQILAKEKKVTIFIPENPLNPNEVVPIGLNGVVYAIPVGQEFEVPESIYKVWKYSYDETRKANQKMDQILSKEIKIL